MKLTNFKVQNFRSFKDSGWISCQSVTAIAGTNEAGKSNLLKALWKLKPAFRQDNKILHNDLPIDRFDEIMDADELPNFISAKFKLTDNEKKYFTKKFKNLPEFSSCIISRSLSGAYSVDYPVTIPTEAKKTIDAMIIKLLPGFVYFSNYGNLDSNIYLPQMLNKFNKFGINTLTQSKKRTVKLLLLYIGITPEMLAEDLPTLQQNPKAVVASADLANLISTQQKYQELFKKAGQRLTKEFNQWWKQGRYVFEFLFDNQNLSIYVTDEKGNRAPLEERSVGIQWFLSFFLVFSLESELFYTNTVLLLDESGATLHGLAQKDLVNFFDKLAEKNQIIYSTHSSFMLPTESLNRARMVYKDNSGHSVVANDFTVNSKQMDSALYPVNSAIGIQLSDTVLKDAKTIVVLTQAEQVFLNIIKNYLIINGYASKAMLQNQIAIIYAGINGLEGTTQLLARENNVLPKVILDEQDISKNTALSLSKKIYRNDGDKIISTTQVGSFYSIEDSFPYEIFATSSANYLVDNFGEIEISTVKPWLTQIADHLTKGEFPENFRLIVAQQTEQYFKSKNYKIKIDKNSIKNWLKIFDFILR